MQSTISVIVPIYNSERYLEKCILSIVGQTYENIEIILVDDASTDGSKKICEYWKNRDKRISLLCNQVNRGAAFSKNKGLEIASGEYISFIDSDDWIASNMLCTMVSILQKYQADIIETPLLKVDSEIANVENMISSPKEEIEILSVEEALKELMMNAKLHQTPCNKLYKRTVIDNIRFPIGKYIDDEFWTYQVIGKSNRVIYYSHYFYYYRQHSSSAMGKKFNIGRLDALDALRERYIYIENCFPKLRYYAYYSFCCLCLYLLQVLISNQDIENYELMKIRIIKMIKDISIRRMIYILIQKNYKQSIWMLGLFIMPITTAKIRNALKLGL